MRFQGVEIYCPLCKEDLHEVGDKQPELRCQRCARQYPVILGIPDLRIFPDPYIALEDDRAKGMHIAEYCDTVDFAGFLDYYYSLTSVVPPQHAQQYKRGVLAAVARARGVLAMWQNHAQHTAWPATGRLLDVGCGTAPFLVAAAQTFPQLVGVDIAFRWLVVAKKRLAQEKLDIPLFCACAEALPFPDGGFTAVVAESVIEHVRDQRHMLHECARMLPARGELFLSTPNRYSLGPDPQAGLWGGGWLPQSWVAAYVRRQGGIPPERQLLSFRALARLLSQSGFADHDIFLPTFPPDQRAHFGPPMQWLIDAYHLARRLPLSRQLMYLLGPLFYTLCKKEG